MSVWREFWALIGAGGIIIYLQKYGMDQANRWTQYAKTKAINWYRSRKPIEPDLEKIFKRKHHIPSSKSRRISYGNFLPPFFR